MPSAIERLTARRDTRRQGIDRLELWNRKLHYYLGLYFLFFLWLFAFTGLLLNHPGWSFAEFWPNRRQSNYERQIQAPPPGSDLEQARNLMGQLGIRGEIEWTTTRVDPGAFEFQVSRPGHILSIKADFHAQRAAVQRIDLNAWGVMHILHTFTGVRMDDPRNQRDWILTTLWALAMDVLAAGLVLMVASGIYMWFALNRKRAAGAIALGLGFVVCGLFAVGLKLLV
jgi:hypothetical protein